MPPPNGNAEHRRWRDEVIVPAGDGVAMATDMLNFEAKHVDHRRGEFAAIAMGISHGGRQTEPSMLAQTSHNRPILDALLKSRPFARIAEHVDTVVKAWSPRLHNYCSDVLDGLEARNANLQRPFPGTSFAACTINFGPQTATLPHRDSGNLSWGWCTVTALGDFDYMRGGQLILWDLNCFVDLRPGASIAIQSALVHHSNTEISEGEMRYSFAQYSAGSLFRWVERGFRPEPKKGKKASDEEVEQEKCRRWARGLDMLGKVGDFKFASKESHVSNVASSSS